MIEMTAEIPGAAKDLFQTLLLQINSPYNLIRLKSIQLLRSMGLTCIEEPFIKTALESIPKKIEEAKVQFDVPNGENIETRELSLAGMTKVFLQRALHRYLISSALSIDTSKILQTKNVFGKDDKARIEAEIIRRSKDKKLKSKSIY